MVPELEQALVKLDAHASQRVYVTYTTQPRAGVVELAAVLGRQWIPMPDHRYVIELLWNLGREPRLDYLPVSLLDHTQSCSALIGQAEQIFGFLDEKDRCKIGEWYARFPENRLGLAPTRGWAFISWNTAM